MCLDSCTRYQMPPFSTSGGGTTQGNSLINENAKLEQDFTKSDGSFRLRNLEYQEHNYGKYHKSDYGVE